MKVGSICASISVTITDIWTKFGTEHKYHHTINTPEWPNSHKLKIQDGGGRHGGGRHLGFRKMWITPNWIELFAQKVGGQMHHGHADMRHGQKSKLELFCVKSLLWWIKIYILNKYRERCVVVSRTVTFPDRRFPDKTFPGQTIPGQTFPGQYVFEAPFYSRWRSASTVWLSASNAA